jgi:hypothetical protein
MNICKSLSVSAILLGLGSVPSFAACEHNGVYYEAGAVLCFGGWLQECTVADYWGAIGMCHVEDVPQSPIRTEIELPEAGEKGL